LPSTTISLFNEKTLSLGDSPRREPIAGGALIYSAEMTFLPASLPIISSLKLFKTGNCSSILRRLTKVPLPFFFSIKPSLTRRRMAFLTVARLTS
jgi:hypothetical protein